jgi:hypothetical protein
MSSLNYGTFKYYIRRKVYLWRRYKKKRSQALYGKLANYHKLAKSTLKSDRLAWCKSADDTHKHQPKQLGIMYLNLRMTVADLLNFRLVVLT